MYYESRVVWLFYKHHAILRNANGSIFIDIFFMACRYPVLYFDCKNK